LKILLDTHTFLWWSLEPERLPQKLLDLLISPTNQIFFSVVSSWEAQIKIGLGKLKLNESLQAIIDKEIKNNQWTVLPVHLQHTYFLDKLPPVHKDPFDRLLIAQGITEDLVLATKDPFILSYKKIKTVW
jgi:PIN domain nuclease of toxin-antitoxin system